MRRLAVFAVAGVLVVTGCSGDDSDDEALANSSSSTGSTSELTEEQLDSCGSAFVDVLAGRSWFTAESFTIVTEPDENLAGVTADGVEWVAGGSVFGDGDVLVVGMSDDEFEAAVEADAVFAVGSPVAVLPMAAQVVDGRLVVFDPPCEGGQQFVDAAGVALGADGDTLLEMLITEAGRQQIAAT